MAGLDGLDELAGTEASLRPGSERARERAVELSTESAVVVAVADAIRKDLFATVVRCAWCGSVKAKHGWHKLDGPLMARAAQSNVLTHSICPPCLERVLPGATELTE